MQLVLESSGGVGDDDLKLTVKRNSSKSVLIGLEPENLKKTIAEKLSQGLNETCVRDILSFLVRLFLILLSLRSFISITYAS